MGNLRARNENEVTARKENILNSAAELLLTEDYDNITLATISEKTNISRPSMYNYYKTKEEIFLDLMVREYLSWKNELEGLFPRKVSRETFCKRLASSLIPISRPHIVWCCDRKPCVSAYRSCRICSSVFLLTELFHRQQA